MNKVEVWEDHKDIVIGIMQLQADKRDLGSKLKDMVADAKVELFDVLEDYNKDRGKLKSFIRKSIQQVAPTIARSYMSQQRLSNNDSRISEVLNAIGNRLCQELGRKPTLVEIADEWDPEWHQASYPKHLNKLPLGDFCTIETESEIKGKLTRVREHQMVLNALPDAYLGDVNAESISLDRLIQMADDSKNPEKDVEVYQIRQVINQRFQELNDLEQTLFILDSGFIPDVADVGEEILELAGDANRKEMASLIKDRNLDDDCVGQSYSPVTLVQDKIKAWLDEIYGGFRSDSILQQAVV